ncbi:MAG: sigma-70 family RNA polymerase sigma factor [Gemmataceae bacterium]
MGDEDADRMGRWQSGDADAFAELVARWQRPIARFLARLVDADRVPDLTQDVFVRVLRAAPRYRPTARFSTWLFQIAVNVARDAGRRKRFEAAPLGDDTACDDDTEQRDLASAVAAAVAELPQPLREVVALRHDQGMNFEDMARLLGTPASTLKSRFAVALGRLRVRLHAMGYSPEESAP